MSDDPIPLAQRLDQLRAKQPPIPEPPQTFETPPAVREWMAGERWKREVPAQFVDAHLDDLGDAAVLDALVAWRQAVLARQGGNLVVTGAVGTGKTHAALATVRTLVEAGLSWSFWPVDELLDALRPNGPDGVAARLASVDVLMLDDLGVERTTEWTAERLHQVVNGRWLSRRPIVATTNLAMPDLLDQLGERTYSRLVDRSVAVRIGGPDRRRTR